MINRPGYGGAYGGGYGGSMYGNSAYGGAYGGGYGNSMYGGGGGMYGNASISTLNPHPLQPANVTDNR